MPCWNAERTIAGSIQSILTQTYENFELIIVNDGSTDNTAEVIKRFNDPRIRYFERPHLGISATRNYGNQQAKGTYCIVQDADDYSLPTRLEKVLSTFKKTQSDVVIHGTYINAWNEQYGCMERHYSPPLSGRKNALENRINGYPAYKRGVWALKPFREETRYVYDLMMNLDWTLSGFKYVTLDEGLYEYVRYQGSASDRFEKSGQRAEGFKIVQKIIKSEYEV
jgi:glycosyltransferase involved in cell wall biosynthesis